jgi:hypothetical protein
MFKRTAIFVVIFALMSCAARAAEIFIPFSGLSQQYPSVMGSSIAMGRLGMTVYGQGAVAKSGNSLFSITGAFPLRGRDNIRQSGWAWGVGAGISDTTQIPGKLLAPGNYFWELLIGRGTVLLSDLVDSGLRGYFEFGYRDDRPRRDAKTSAALSNIEREVPDHNNSLVLRFGTAVDAKGEGLVAQKIGWPLWALNVSFVLPVINQHPVVIDVHTHALARCYGDSFTCGLGFEYQYLRDTVETPLSEDLETRYSIGPRAVFQFKNYRAGLDVRWVLLASNFMSLGSGTPLARTWFTIGF